MDSANNKSYIFDSFSSSSRIQFGYNFSVILSDHVNSVMHHVMEAFIDYKHRTVQYREEVKNIVRVRSLNMGSGNNELPAGHKLKQEVCTIFGTVHDVFERFLISSDNVAEM